MNFGPLSQVFGFFGSKETATVTTAQKKEPVAKPRVCYENKLFIYMGGMDSDAPLTETVIDLYKTPKPDSVRTLRIPSSARPVEIPAFTEPFLA